MIRVRVIKLGIVKGTNTMCNRIAERLDSWMQAIYLVISY